MQAAWQTDTTDSIQGCRQSGEHGQAREQAGRIAGSIAGRTLMSQVLTFDVAGPAADIKEKKVSNRQKVWQASNRQEQATGRRSHSNPGPRGKIASCSLFERCIRSTNER